MKLIYSLIAFLVLLFVFCLVYDAGLFADDPVSHYRAKEHKSEATKKAERNNRKLTGGYYLGGPYKCERCDYYLGMEHTSRMDCIEHLNMKVERLESELAKCQM